jgi:hypothetical protein
MTTNKVRLRSAEMTATMYADLHGVVPRALIADMLRAVLDENQQTAQQPAPEQLMLEVRRRLDRLARARSPRTNAQALDNHPAGLVR